MYGWSNFGEKGKKGEKMGGKSVWLRGGRGRKLVGPGCFSLGPTKT